MNVHSFLIACLLPLVSVASADVSTQDPVPDPPTVAKWNTQHWVPVRYKVVKANLVDQECGILFVGDSITEGWETAAGSALWKEHFLPMKAVNFGVSGDRTESMLWRMEDSKLAVKTPPAYCVLMAGTNNIGYWKGKQKPEDTVRGIREIAQRLLKAFPKTKLVIMAVTPYGPDPKGEYRKLQEEINERLLRVKLPRTHILSINDKLLNQDGSFREGMFKDDVHLTAKGYQVWADSLLPLLNKKP